MNEPTCEPGAKVEALGRSYAYTGRGWKDLKDGSIWTWAGVCGGRFGGDPGAFDMPSVPQTLKTGETLTITHQMTYDDGALTFTTVEDEETAKRIPMIVARSAAMGAFGRSANLAHAAAEKMAKEFWAGPRSHPLSQQAALEELKKQREFEANHVTPAEVDEALESIRRSASALDERPES